ncbi:hypothetical protein K438DRAFT_1766610 [Mycena galopus ATCC 62051]|nr:hypothetical protein K438DRAFT_1766610 [Mycena galopus ATCC 62051]
MISMICTLLADDSPAHVKLNSGDKICHLVSEFRRRVPTPASQKSTTAIEIAPTAHPFYGFSRLSWPVLHLSTLHKQVSSRLGSVASLLMSNPFCLPIDRLISSSDTFPIRHISHSSWWTQFSHLQRDLRSHTLIFRVTMMQYNTLCLPLAVDYFEKGDALAAL